MKTRTRFPSTECELQKYFCIGEFQVYYIARNTIYNSKWLVDDEDNYCNVGCTCLYKRDPLKVPKILDSKFIVVSSRCISLFYNIDSFLYKVG